MVPPEMRQQPHVSFTQLDQYLRCPLKYRFTYVDRLKPDFVPAALAFGSGIHGAVPFSTIYCVKPMSWWRTSVPAPWRDSVSAGRRCSR